MSDIQEKESYSIEISEVEEQKKCSYCMADIPKFAIVCKICRSYQHWFRHNLPNATLFVSIFMLVISSCNLLESRVKRIEANKASAEAQDAASRADIALAKAQAAAERTEFLFHNVRNQALSLSKIIWLQAAAKHQFGGPLEKMLKNESLKSMSMLVAFAIHDKEARKKWIEDFNKQLPQDYKLAERDEKSSQNQ